MNKVNEEFYITKYTKGYSGNLVAETKINLNLSALQKIFNIDPNNPDIIIRNMVECYGVSSVQAIKLAPYVKFNFDLKNYDYQTALSSDDYGKEYYIIEQFEKSKPWHFVEECKLNIEINFLRDLFSKERYSSDPAAYGFSVLINSNPKYVMALQPFTPFKIEVDKYDYWCEGRAKGEKRPIGQEGEEFIG